MIRLKNFLKFASSHKAAIIAALFVSAIYGGHHILVERIAAEKGERYFPVTLESNYDEAITYAPRAKAAYEGNFLNGDFSLYEYRDANIATLPILNPVIMAGIGRLTGSVERAFVAADFIFPPLIFLALYALFFELFRNRVGALLAATLFIFAPKLGLYVPPTSLDAVRWFFADLFFVFNDPNPNGLYFSRFEYPQMAYIFYVLAFCFTLRALKTKRTGFENLGGGAAKSVRWRIWRGEGFQNLFSKSFCRLHSNVFLAGVSFGILFYTYFYDWAYFFVALSLTFAVFLVLRDFARAKQIAGIVFTGFVVSIPYWVNFFELASLPQYKDIVSRVGVEISNQFRIEAWTTYVRVVVLASALWFLWRARDKAVVVFLAGLLLAMVVVLNAQVITGFNPQPDHWHRVQFLPVFAAVALLAAWVYSRFVRVPPKYGRASWILFIMLIFSIQAHSQYRFAAEAADAHLIDAAYAAAYAWLAGNAPDDSVVASLSPETNIELSLRADNFLFLPSGLNTIAPSDELWKRFFIVSSLSGVSLERFGVLISESGLLGYVFHGQYRDSSHNSFLDGYKPRKLSPELYAEKLRAYHELLLQEASPAGPYRLDYLIIGPREEALGAVPAAPANVPAVFDAARISAEKVFESDGISLYSIR